MKNRIVIFFLLFATSIFGQTLEDWMMLGDQAMEENDPYGALRYYKTGMELDSMKGTLIYKVAEAYRGVQNYQKATYYYDKIFRRDRGMIFDDVGMKLAEMQMQSGKYAEAKINWRRVRDQFRDEPNSYTYQKATQSIRSCDLAEKWSAEPKPFELTGAGDPVNSGDSEFGGNRLNDGKLSFTSLRGEYDGEGRLESEAYFIKSYVADSNLAEVQPYPISSIDLSANYGNLVESNQGQKALVMIDDQGQRSIHFYDGLIWRKILPNVESDTSNYTHPAFGRFGDLEVLYFASDRRDGFGQYDLWFVELTKPDDLTNMGPVINTPGNEVTPFYRTDNDILFFSSDWHHGFGGYDVFQAPYYEGEFSFPENLKAPFSTPSNDLYYSFNPSIKKGSLTSNRVGEDDFGGCCNNLFLFEEKEIIEADTLPQIATLEDLNKYLPVTLYFHNDEPDPRTRNKETDKDYLETYRDYIQLLPAYRDEYRAGLNQSDGDQAEEAMDDFFLNEIDQGVNDLALFSELLKRELEEGAQIEITVKGFASPLAATDYNVNLTQRRISSLENYLRNYERGSLHSFLDETAENSGLLRISKIPFGEYVAEKLVSDNPNESNAVYSIAAAKERKIEIVSVTRATEDSSLAEVRFESEIIDLGSVNKGDSVSFRFDFEVVNAKPFAIDSVTKSSEVEFPIIEEYTQGTHSINGILVVNEIEGKQNTIITLFGNLPGRKKQLNLTFEVE
ncbi:hypothetical protein O3Q51_13065 [Cryomorphaceae bacterium 1068]|nr:hypothetical protein [Cryomorphaceae bacterium 1068]